MRKTLFVGACLVLQLTACTTPSPTRELAPMPSLASSGPARGCVPDTATRLPVRAQECGAFGQSYTGEQLLRTGVRDTSEALRLLDPTVQVHGR
jgi:hypothetical protein